MQLIKNSEEASFKKLIISSHPSPSFALTSAQLDFRKLFLSNTLKRLNYDSSDLTFETFFITQLILSHHVRLRPLFIRKCNKRMKTNMKIKKVKLRE